MSTRDHTSESMTFPQRRCAGARWLHLGAVCALAATAFAPLGFAQVTKGSDPFDPAAVTTEKPEDGSELVQMRVLLTPRIMFPDYPAVLAIVFDIEPGWHLYWKNSGDTGMPIRLSITLPEGLKAGEPFWPGPKRYPMPGDLLDYIYEDQVVLFVPIGGESGPRSSIDVTVKAEWLVCQEACLPGQATVETTIVAGSTVPDEDIAILDKSLIRLPFPLHSRATTQWEDNTLVITTRGTAVTFFPEYDRNAKPVNILRDGEAKGPELRIAYDARVKDAERVRGVLEIRNNIGRSAFYEVDIAPPR